MTDMNEQIKRHFFKDLLEQSVRYASLPDVPTVLTSTARMPEYAPGDDGAIGLDLFADVTGNEHGIHIPMGSHATVCSGVSLAVPLGWFCYVADRSGLAKNKGIKLGGRIVDGSYRGKIGIIVFNHGHAPFYVHKHDKIAQLIFVRADRLRLSIVDSLPDTARGERGFGSTGL